MFPARPCRTPIYACKTLQDNNICLQDPAGDQYMPAGPCRTTIYACRTLQDNNICLQDPARDQYMPAEPCRTTIYACRTMQETNICLQDTAGDQYMPARSLCWLFFAISEHLSVIFVKWINVSKMFVCAQCPIYRTLSFSCFCFH